MGRRRRPRTRRPAPRADRVRGVLAPSAHRRGRPGARVHRQHTRVHVQPVRRVPVRRGRAARHGERVERLDGRVPLAQPGVRAGRQAERSAQVRAAGSTGLVAVGRPVFGGVRILKKNIKKTVLLCFLLFGG